LGRSEFDGIQIGVIRELGHPQEHAIPEPPAATGGLGPEEIWSAVERILNSRAMRGCNRLVQLLTFVVSSTLRGEATQLKETTIGVSVFGRSPDYDPKLDTIVRSQAWRLRAKLKKYYASEGADERIIIEIPVGHYVPTFHLREEVEVGH
jgi:hypothetical protein